jgi:uncharacterized membrane protein
MVKIRISTRDIAMTAIFAALSWIASEFVPGIPIVGASGSRISFDATLAPIYGIIIGPYLGFLAALIGGLVAAGSLFTILTSFCTGISAFVAGMLVTRRTGNNKVMQGWMFSAIALALLIVGWYSTEVGRQASFYPIPHLVGLLIILAARGWIANKIEGERKGKALSPMKGVNSEHIIGGAVAIMLGTTCYFTYLDLTKVVEGLSVTGILSFLAYSLLVIGVFSIIYGFFSWIRPGFVTAVVMACYCGIIADHMLGNLIFLGMIDVVAPKLTNVPSVFMAVLPISVAERSLFTAIATIIAVALLSVLRRSGIIYRKTQ